MRATKGQFNEVGKMVKFLRAKTALLYGTALCGDTGSREGCRMKNMGEKMRRLAQAVRAAANALRPRLRAFWDRFGYVTSMVALLALIGVAATIYRGRTATPTVPAPTATPEPALASSLNLGAEAEEEEAAFLPPLTGDVVGEVPPRMRWYGRIHCSCGKRTRPSISPAPLGTAVTACADGTVTQAYRDPLLGYTVRIEHEDGYESLYACLQSAEMVAVGQSVRMGETIGAVGESADAEAELGAHLHFAFFLDGENVQPPTRGGVGQGLFACIFRAQRSVEGHVDKFSLVAQSLAQRAFIGHARLAHHRARGGIVHLVLRLDCG